MRKVRLEHLTPNMRLAKPVYHHGAMLLKDGATNLTKFTPNLRNLGVYSLYIEDEISEGIEIEDVIHDETRLKCKTELERLMSSLTLQGANSSAILSDTITLLLDDILSNTNILVSLSDIGTTDDSTFVHSVNTTVFSLIIAQQLDFSMFELRKLAEGSLLHDVGKIVLNPEILYKSTPITVDEFIYIKEHALLGYNLLKQNINFTELSRIIALQHHERLDGSGYPYGLHKDQIHTFSKIVAIADMYDALTAERCYRPGLSNYDAHQILLRDSGTKIDSELLFIFLKHIAIYPNGATVRLSDGTRGIVKSQNPDLPLRPVVRVIEERPDTLIKLYDIDLSSALNVTIL